MIVRPIASLHAERSDSISLWYYIHKCVVRVVCVCVCILKVNRTLPCLCVDTFMRNPFRDSGERLAVQEVPLLFHWEMSFHWVGAMHFECFDLLGLMSQEGCVRSVENAIFISCCCFLWCFDSSYRTTGASWENGYLTCWKLMGNVI